MHFKKYYLLFVVLIFSSVQAQLETVNWYFGQYLGLRFEGDQVIPMEGGQLYTGEGCASISDKLESLGLLIVFLSVDLILTTLLHGLV